MSTVNNIGKIIYTNTNQIDSEVHCWKRLIPNLEKIREQYQTLELGHLTEKTFGLVLKGDLEPIFQKAIVTIKNKMKAVSSDTLLKLTIADLTQKFEQLEKQYKTFSDLKTSICFSATAYHVLEWEDLKFVGGQIIIDEDRITKRNQTRIETEEENDLYNRLIALQDQWNSMVDYVKDRGFDIHRNSLIQEQWAWGFFDKDLEGYLEILPLQIKWPQKPVAVESELMQSA